MKKITYLGLVALVGMILSYPIDVRATQYQGNINNIDKLSENLFFDLEETDLVLEMPEGGFLHGQVTVYSTSDLNKSIAEYDSETDLNSITVSEAKEVLKVNALEAKNNVAVQPYGVSVPSTLLQLDAGATYRSEAFSGSGWRFSGMQFRANPNTGDFLRWTALIDSGMVGNYSEALSTYNGNMSGTSIGANATIMNSENGQGQIFYTYNPIPGSGYIVANLELNQ